MLFAEKISIKKQMEHILSLLKLHQLEMVPFVVRYFFNPDCLFLYFTLYSRFFQNADKFSKSNKVEGM